VVRRFLLEARGVDRFLRDLGHAFERGLERLVGLLGARGA
jgi:hypothetical protein